MAVFVALVVASTASCSQGLLGLSGESFIQFTAQSPFAGNDVIEGPFVRVVYGPVFGPLGCGRGMSDVRVTFNGEEVPLLFGNRLGPTMMFRGSCDLAATASATSREARIAPEGVFVLTDPSGNELRIAATNFWSAPRLLEQTKVPMGSMQTFRAQRGDTRRGEVLSYRFEPALVPDVDASALIYSINEDENAVPYEGDVTFTTAPGELHVTVPDDLPLGPFFVALRAATLPASELTVCVGGITCYLWDGGGPFEPIGTFDHGYVVE